MFEEPFFHLMLKQATTIYSGSIDEMGQAPCWQGCLSPFRPLHFDITEDFCIISFGRFAEIRFVVRNRAACDA
jgi:hypothetical protein